MNEDARNGVAQSSDADAEIPLSTHPIGSAVGWSYVANAVRLASTLGTAFVLASLLGPRAFGTVALALIFVTLVQLLIQQGLTPAIVQRQGLTWRHLDSAFWLSVAISVGLSGLSVIMSPWWAEANGTPDAKHAIWALSSLIVIKGLVVVQESYLQRQLRFRDLALRTTIGSVCGAIVGIVWAVVRPSIWALVAQQLVSGIVGAIVIWSIVSWRPRFAWRTSDALDLLGFALTATLSSIGVFVSTRVDAVLIGLYFGAVAIGLYQLAFRLMQAAIETMVYPIAGVALADLSRRQDDKAAAAERYTSLVGAATVIGTPVLATIFACAPALMNTVGPEWAPAGPVLQLMCVVGVATIIGMLASPALQAAGRPGAQAAIVWIGAAISAVTFAVAGALLRDSSTRAQVIGMAGSRAVVYVLVLLPISQVMVARHLGVGLIRIARVVAPPILASVAGAVAGLLVGNALDAANVPSWLVTALVGLTTLAVATPLLLAVAPYARTVKAGVLSRIPDGMAPAWVQRNETRDT